MDDVGRAEVDDDGRVDRDDELVVGEGPVRVLVAPQPLLAGRLDLERLDVAGGERDVALGGPVRGGLQAVGPGLLDVAGALGDDDARDEDDRGERRRAARRAGRSRAAGVWMRRGSVPRRARKRIASAISAPLIAQEEDGGEREEHPVQGVHVLRVRGVCGLRAKQGGASLLRGPRGRSGERRRLAAVDGGLARRSQFRWKNPAAWRPRGRPRRRCAGWRRAIRSWPRG